MAVDRDKILEFCNETLDVKSIKDYARNGMQVEGKEEIKKIALGVSANLELFRKAAEWGADMIIVHHGLFWETDAFSRDNNQYDFNLSGFLKKRVKHLLDNDLSLLAYHLPLDRHQVIGNNAQFFLKARIRNVGNFGVHDGHEIGMFGDTKIGRDELIKRVNDLFGANSLVLNYGPEECKRIGFISGSGASHINEALMHGVDTFITGIIDEMHPAIAKENNMNLIVPGHYNSEKLGIQALAELIKKRFKVETNFIEIPNTL